MRLMRFMVSNMLEALHVIWGFVLTIIGGVNDNARGRASRLDRPPALLTGGGARDLHDAVCTWLIS